MPQEGGLRSNKSPPPTNRQAGNASAECPEGLSKTIAAPGPRSTQRWSNRSRCQRQVRASTAGVRSLLIVVRPIETTPSSNGCRFFHQGPGGTSPAMCPGRGLATHRGDVIRPCLTLVAFRQTCRLVDRGLAHSNKCTRRKESSVFGTSGAQGTAGRGDTRRARQDPPDHDRDRHQDALRHAQLADDPQQNRAVPYAVSRSRRRDPNSVVDAEVSTTPTPTGGEILESETRRRSGPKCVASYGIPTMSWPSGGGTLSPGPLGLTSSATTRCPRASVAPPGAGVCTES